MANDQRSSAGIGCLGTIVGLVVVALVVVLVFFVGLVVLAVVAGLVVVGFVVWAIDRVLLALSPKRRERRAAQQRMILWQFGQRPPDVVFDTTAFETTAADSGTIDTTAVDTTAIGEKTSSDPLPPEPPGSTEPP